MLVAPRTERVAWHFAAVYLGKVEVGCQPNLIISSRGGEVTEGDVAASDRGPIWRMLASREIVVIFLVGLLILIVTLFIQGTKEGGEAALLKGLEALSLSFIEAALIMIVIEMRTSREQVEQSRRMIQSATDESRKLIQEAIRDLFRSFYQKRVPKELIQLYEETAFKKAFFRTNHRYTYTFSDPWTGGDKGAADMIKVTVYHAYTMHNLLDTDQVYEFECEISLPPNEEDAKLCEYFELRVNDHTIEGSKKERVQRVGYKALLITHSETIPARGSKSFEGRWQAIRRNRDVEVLMTTWPSDGIVMDVVHGPWFGITLTALHFQELQSITTGDHSKKWTLKAGMIPGQGVSLEWELLSSK